MTRFEHGYAVVVGVGDDLPATVIDAKQIGEMLTDPKHCAFPKENVCIRVENMAKRDGILKALDCLAAKVAKDPKATAIVYFSGHGIDGEPSYLLANGYAMGSLANTAVSSHQFTERLRAIRAKKLVVLLDCCHAGAQAEAKAGPIPKAPIPIEALEKFQEGSGRVVLASSRRSEFSYVGDGNSYFTQAICEALSGHGAAEEDRYCRVLDLAMYAAQVVPERTYDQQHPMLKVANLEDNFRVAYYAAGDSKPDPIKKGLPRSEADKGMLAERTAGWQRELNELRGRHLKLEQEIVDHEQGTVRQRALHAQQEQVDNRMLELRGKLQQLPEQAEQARSLTMMWSVLGLLLFFLTYAVWARTQGWPPLPGMPRLEEWGRHAVAFFGLLYGLPLIALSLTLVRIYQSQELKSGFLNRLPIAFSLPLYSPTPLRNRYQAVVFFLFLAFPLAGQVHFFGKMCRGKVYERSGWIETDIPTGIVGHLTSPVSLEKMFEGDRDVFRLDSDPGSITYFPFVQPWLFLILEMVLFIYLMLTVRQMIRPPNGEPSRLKKGIR